MANEKRLIDATELIDEINEAISNIAFTSPYQNDIATMISGMERVLDIVEDVPTVDAVEVCRCKDCRKCRIYDDVITRQKQYECRLWHGATREVSADSFCDAGERREGE